MSFRDKLWGPSALALAQFNMECSTVNLLLFLAVSALSVQVSLQEPDQARLYMYLLKDYNRLVRPVIKGTDAITVEISLDLVQILDVDEKNQILKINSYLKLSWRDHYLQWNESDFPGSSPMTFPYNSIWTPDILLQNTADERFDPTFPTKILVNSDGNCFYYSPGIFKSTCQMDMRWFPFDVQRCDLKLASSTYNGMALKMQVTDPETENYLANGEWDLVEVKGEVFEHVYACCPESYPHSIFTVVMRRRTLYYGINLLIPCMLISTMALLVFLLPADSGEKISLGFTVLLSMTVLLLLVAEIMPATSNSVPLIAQYFVSTMVIVGLSIIATVVVLRYHHHDPHGVKMPKWTRVVLLNWCAWFLRMKRPGEDQVRAGHNKAPHNSLELSTSAPASQTNDDKMLYVGVSPDSGVLCGQLVGRGGEEEMLLPAGHSSSVEPTLAKILNEVHFIAKHFHEKDEAESVCSEWKFAASVIDRLCLMIFSLLTILCTIGILMSAPNFVESIFKDLSK